jgi:hypothetical protein
MKVKMERVVNIYLGNAVLFYIYYFRNVIFLRFISLQEIRY